MNLENLANEYLKSAEKIKQRIIELKQMQIKKNFKEQKKIEDRIVILNAEYYHLINIASYLMNYYNNKFKKKA